MIIYIILGALVFGILSFLVISFVVDKKRKKKHTIKKSLENRDKTVSNRRIAIMMNVLIKEAQKKLKNFVPAIGELKMNDIRKMTKVSFQDIEKTNDFKLFMSSEHNEDKKMYELLKSTSVSLWSKKTQNAIDFFSKKEPKELDTYEARIKKTISAKIKGNFKDEFTK